MLCVIVLLNGMILALINSGTVAQVAFPNIGTQFTSETAPRLGRPKGSKNFATLIRDMVEDENYKIKLENGKWLKKPGKAIAQAMAIKASQGDVQAATWMAKFGYGEKLTTALDVTSNGETVGVNPTMSADFATYLLEKTKVPPTVVEGEIVSRENVVTTTTPETLPPTS